MEKEQQEALLRWRLILGEESQEALSGMGAMPLREEDLLLDQTLETIYGSFSQEGSAQGAGLGGSRPQLSKWMKDIRSLFDQDLVKIIQQDAIEKRGWKQLLMEPELLDSLEPDIELAGMLLTLKDMVPTKSKEHARRYIEKIVEQINASLNQDIQRSITAALHKKEHSPIPNATSIDFPYTIRKNLKHYSQELQTIIPEKVYFFEHKEKTNHWHVILDIDQSGSMSSSMMYSSITACILASMRAIKTSIVAFDTNIMDLSDLCEDPIELLYGFQLGGGTDIHKSIRYCESLIEEPSKTILFLISDLEEGGNHAGLLHRLQTLKEAGVSVVSLLAIQDGGKPYYSADMAQRIANLEIPCFACTPQKLPELLFAVFQKQDLTKFSSSN